MIIYGIIVISIISYIIIDTKKADNSVSTNKAVKNRIKILSIIAVILLCIIILFKLNLWLFGLAYGYFGILFIIMGLDTLQMKNACTKEIEGTYLGYIHRTYGRGYKTNIAKFRYIVNDSTYIEESFQHFTRIYLRKNFIKNKTYLIYINPNNIKSFIITKNLTLSEISFFILGICFLLFPLSFFYYLKI